MKTCSDFEKLIIAIKSIQRNYRGAARKRQLTAYKAIAREYHSAGFSFRGTRVFVSTRRELGVF